MTNKIPNSSAQKRVRHQLEDAPPYSNTALVLSPPSPGRSGSSILIDCGSEGSQTKENQARRWTGKSRRQVVSINTLPEDVLLEIFVFYVDETEDEDDDTSPFDEKGMIESWQTLVHVCRRWRSVVFGSPRRLKLQLVYTCNTPARDTLDVWPPLPLSIRARSDHPILDPMKSADIISVLECRDRVHEIIFENVLYSDLKNISKAMQEPFPELTNFLITVWHGETDGTEPVPPLPDSFLGGSAPRLQDFTLSSIPFPALPKLLLSTTHLAYLALQEIPHSAYISPEAMATVLSALTSLGFFELGFQSPRSFPDQASRRPSPPTRPVLPLLERLEFKGATEYLDDLVSHIDAPQLGLGFLGIALFNQIFFESPQLIQFITRSRFKSPEKAQITFESRAARIALSSITSDTRDLTVRTLCRELDWQVSSLEQVCASCLPPLSTLEDLYITQDTDSEPDWKDNVENALWLELFNAFSNVKNLYLSEEFAPRIVPALQELVGARTSEVLPILENIFVEGLGLSGPIQEGIGKFVAARQVTDHPLALSRWDRGRERLIY